MRYFGKNIMMVLENNILSYTDEGPEDAPAIIFIHGFPLNKTMWNTQVELLHKKYRVITYDIRGHGNSDTGDEPFSIDLFADDLVALMDKLAVEKASVCGLSMGGYIALYALQKYPGRFESLVLADTTCIADSPEAKEKRIASMENIQANGTIKYADASVGNLFAPESIEKKIPAVEQVKEMIESMTEEALIMTLKALAGRHETCSFLPEINIPTLIIVGEKDKITPPESAHNMHDRIKNSHLFIIANAGHLSNLEQPEEFDTRLGGFFDTVYKKEEPPAPSDNSSFLSQMRDKLAMLLAFKPI